MIVSLVEAGFPYWLCALLRGSLVVGVEADNPKRPIGDSELSHSAVAGESCHVKASGC